MVAKHRGVSDGRFKLMPFYELGEWEFYELDADPQEQTNQYGNPYYADVVTRLKTPVPRPASVQPVAEER